MADLKYIVRITHKEKGIGFVTRDALRNSQKQPHSLIKKAAFAEESSTERTVLEVTVDDGHIGNFIRNTIEKSGRMPSGQGNYSIDSIEFVEESISRERVKELEKNLGSTQRQLGALRDENGKLKHEAGSKKIEIGSPVEGLLAYFETKKYLPELIFEDPAEIGFARRVVCEHTGDTFEEYANHMLGRRVAQEDIEAALSYKSEEPEELKGLKTKYDIAKSEMHFLAKLKEGSQEIPESLRGDYIKLIEAKGHDETIKEYEGKVKERQETGKLKDTIEKLKERHSAFSENFGLISQAGNEVEVIFAARNGDKLDVYFPFVARNMKAGFIEDLKKELQAYFEQGSIVEARQLENKFVAYSLTGINDITGKISHVMDDVPFTLRIAGFNKVVPYRIGK